MKDEEYLEKVLSKMLDKEVRLIFQENPAVETGSCIIETRGGQLDSSFGVQIESIKLAFEKYLGEEIELLEPDSEEDLPEQETNQIETSEANEASANPEAIEETHVLDENPVAESFTDEAQLEEIPETEAIKRASTREIID